MFMRLSTFTGLDWITGLSLKSKAYRFTITCDLFVQCMRQEYMVSLVSRSACQIH